NFGAAITAPTATMTGHTFLGWNATPATTMPAQNVTYTAQWSIAAKHFLQNIDGSYPATPEATENVSGGAGEYVTPAVKTFDGFITPTTQTVQIGQTTEVTYQYARRIYTITLDATTNGGTCATASLNVKHGATPTLPVASKAGQILDGWFTKAVGGDQITNETLILRNIGTLYAHYVDAPVVEVDLVVSATQTLDVSTTVGTTTITTNGALTIPNGLTLTTGDLILEATQNESGQVFTADNNITVTGNAYFDMTLNAQTRTWYGVGVPWRVNAQYGIYGGADKDHLTLLRLGKDFDIIWYDGEIRATAGPVSMCYKYLEDIGDPNNRIVEPGRMYFMFFARPYNVIRFQKLTDAALVNEGNVTTERYTGAADETNHGWNGIANPGLTHVTIPGATPNAGYRYNSVNIDNKSLTQWVPVLNLQAETFVVGQPIMVQLPQTGGINLGMVRTAASSAPLRKMAANGDIDRAEVVMTSSTGLTDRILCAVDDEARDEYTIGSDLVKFTNSDELPQLWINNYKHALAINTVRLENSVATYPLTIVSPKAGDYTLSLANKLADGIHVYLTLNGEAIADLTEGEYVLTMGKETSKAYGIRLVRGPRGTVTAIDEALEGKENVEKVVKDGVLYIIRQGNVYDASGRKVE
ncbi:MAG: InlB B-repeat-containing protein, partial [Paludibacteraceae bacterium]|nr:InlB B-repeat-containing protein [Paludibacteraceae bacterium]